MKRLRIERWGGSLLPPRNPRLQCPFSANAANTSSQHSFSQNPHRLASRQQQRCFTASRSTRQVVQEVNVTKSERIPRKSRAREPPSDIPSQSTQSAKLAALHARLSLPARFPLNTLRRCLIHASADQRPEYNNSSLAILGQEIMGYYTSEWLLCNYPRLPMPIIFAAQYAYCGPKTLGHMRAEWGVEAAAAPGEEVDPGLLQFSKVQAGNAMASDLMSRVKDFEGIKAKGTGRNNEEWNYRRGTSSRIVYDDQFGDLQSGVNDAPIGAMSTSQTDAANSTPGNTTPPPVAPSEVLDTLTSTEPVTLEVASASFISAVFGALYLHSGTASTQTFYNNHILSRHLPLHTLFNFKYPTRDLSRLCESQGFEPPVARLISETGRLSRTPVFVVGVFSGEDKLGEDAGSSLDEARVRAAAAALRSWYLYSPPRDQVCLPSQSDKEGIRWKAQMVDLGEIVT